MINELRLWLVNDNHIEIQRQQVNCVCAASAGLGCGDGTEVRRIMQDLGNTQYFKVQAEPETGVKVVLYTVYQALTEKGYNPVNQIVGYIMSGDPTYITSHKNARSMIMKVERDELVEELLTEYIRKSNWQ